MAIGDPYATEADLELRLGVSDDGTFTLLLASASRAVEAFTRRQFNRDDAASPRRFRALDCERLPVDDFWELDYLDVVVDGVAWDVGTSIDARPWDGIVEGQIAWPYSDLFAVGRSWPWSRRALITVTAPWGWLSVPAGIIEATLQTAEMLYFRRANPSQTRALRSETFDNYSYTFAFPDGRTNAANVPPEMFAALPFRRKIFGVA